MFLGRHSEFWASHLVHNNGGRNPRRSLQSIDLTPSTTTPTGGSTMTFTAMGAYGASHPVDITTLVAWHSHSPSVLMLNPGSGVAAVAADPGQIVHVYASFIGINSQPVRIVVQ